MFFPRVCIYILDDLPTEEDRGALYGRCPFVAFKDKEDLCIDQAAGINMEFPHEP